MLGVATEFVLHYLTLQDCKTVAEIVSGIVGPVAAIIAVKTYRNNSQRERAKWAVQLHEKFYEDDRYKNIRELLDSDGNTPEVRKLVEEEAADFTDYLNFFELVSFLVETKQLSKADVLSLFHYYLRCLQLHSVVMKYLNKRDKGFEQLSEFFRTTKL